MARVRAEVDAELDKVEWTDAAGAARVVGVREETIASWARQEMTAEEAYQTTVRRGSGFAWRIRLDALRRVATQHGCLRWHPDMATPTSADATRLLVDALAAQREEIARLKEQVRALAAANAAST
jgi:hypothetical protein